MFSTLLVKYRLSAFTPHEYCLSVLQDRNKEIINLSPLLTVTVVSDKHTILKIHTQKVYENVIEFIKHRYLLTEVLKAVFVCYWEAL